jgi:hypothetical protein
MKIKSVSTLIVLASVSITALTGCGKKSTPQVPYPTVNPATTTGTTAQNYDAYQQTGAANPAYQGNGAYLADDTGEFDDTTKTNTATDTKTNTPAADETEIADSTPEAGTDDLDTGLPDLEPYSPPGGANSGSNGYTLAGTFPVDQDSYIPSSIPFIGALAPTRNQWQAVGIAAVGSDIIISAKDSSGLFKKGTVITMNGETGKDWKNVGSAWLGLKHPMDATVKGITVDENGNIFASDSSKYIYSLAQPSFSVTLNVSGVSGAMDIASVGTSLIVASTSGLKKFDSSALTSGTDFAAGVTPSGGIGSDSAGNIYVVSGSTIKKINSSGSASDFVTGVTGAIDVVANNSNQVCVLTSDGIKMYDAAGKALSTFGSGDYSNAMAIATNGTDIFVADAGQSYKNSMVVKYSVMSL